MALIDVKLYYTKIESQYFEMLNDVKDLEEAFKDGILSESQILQAKEMLDKVKTQYLTWSAMMFELNKPKRKHKIKKYKRQNKGVEEVLGGYTPNDIIDENTDVLVKFKQYVKQLKDERK